MIGIVLVHILDFVLVVFLVLILVLILRYVVSPLLMVLYPDSVPG